MNTDKIALGLDYDSITGIAELIARKTGLRALQDFEALAKGMGALVKRVPANQWAHEAAVSCAVRAPNKFEISLGLPSSPLDRLLIACALGNYILHAHEGKKPSVFYRFSKNASSVEALWFGMAIVIPDQSFLLSEKTTDISDQTRAELFQVPLPLIALKRKLIYTAIKNKKNTA